MNVVRKLIREVLGVQSDINRLANMVLEKVYKDLAYDQSDPVNVNHQYFDSSFFVEDENILNNTRIELVSIQVYYKDKGEDVVTGAFSSKNTELQLNGFFKTQLSLRIQVTDTDLVKNRVLAVIAHELNHAFVYIKKFNRPSKTDVLNKVKNKVKNMPNLPKELKEFMEMFYLNLPQEIQARVQEIGAILDRIEFDNAKEATDELYKNAPAHDAIRMMQYKVSDIKRLSPEVLSDFITYFNTAIKDFKNKEKFTIITDPNKFFDYWEKYINLGGRKLNDKIFALIQDKYKITEGRLFVEIYDKLDYIFGNFD